MINKTLLALLPPKIARDLTKSRNLLKVLDAFMATSKEGDELRGMVKSAPVLGVVQTHLTREIAELKVQNKQLSWADVKLSTLLPTFNLPESLLLHIDEIFDPPGLVPDSYSEILGVIVGFTPQMVENLDIAKITKSFSSGDTSGTGPILRKKELLGAPSNYKITT